MAFCTRVRYRGPPLIAGRDVHASTRWCADLLGAAALPDHPRRDVYDRI